MKTELFELLKKAFLTKAGVETICALFSDDDDERLTNSQVRLLIEEKILPRLDKEENDEEEEKEEKEEKEEGKEKEVRCLWSLLLYKLKLMPKNLCYTCLEICPKTLRFCGHCDMYKCRKCMPIIPSRYPGEHYRYICIKCLSDVISKSEDRFLYLNLFYMCKHFHIIPRKMDSLIQKKIAEGAVEMQARPSGSIYKEAKEDFELHKKTSNKSGKKSAVILTS